LQEQEKLARTISIFRLRSVVIYFALSLLIFIYLSIYSGKQKKFPGSGKHRFVAVAIDITGRQQRCRYVDIN